MKTYDDDDIKKALHDNIQRIDDNSFTDRLVAKHLSNRKIQKNSLFLNFLPIVIGLSAVILNTGLVLLIRQNSDWINEIGITENHGLIMLMLSFLFLIYKWLEGITDRPPIV